ncbi:MBL fold metallo-hydrolase [Williamsia soli]|uniref:MBL fold metallo-hydrolase n=1 Tax=Williamsia soli TaxID=364929 RepID=UPI001A9F7EE5|nr:MBL fold metallo-hydrolase [Williamsia soli]
MTTGTIHEISPGLFLIEGHHPHTLWDDPDLPTIAVYRSGTRLYLLDTGVGADQYSAIVDVASRFTGIEEVYLLNSHGHVDHLGNNHVLHEIRSERKYHLIPRDARPGLDYEAFFSRMYKSGIPYFDYLRGLDLDADRIAGLLRTLSGASALTAEDVLALGRQINGLGLSPAVGAFIPSLVVDIILQTYPEVFLSVDTMTDYEDHSPAEDIAIGGTRWTGWSFVNAEGTIDVQVLQSAGHSAGGLVYYLPGQKFMMFADETSALPIWTDSDPRNTVATAVKALQMIDEGNLEHMCAGHKPMLPVAGDHARAQLQQIINTEAEFSHAVADALRRHPDGMSIDDLYEVLREEAPSNSVIAVAAGLQFPVFATFLKLTLLNHCRLHEFPVDTDLSGRPTFRLPAH